jgi:hypothetical protein
LNLCDYCGKYPGEIVDSNGDVFLCRNCFSQAGTCYLCVNGALCEFETNPSPLPKQVQKTVRQGNMMVQTVIRNPDRTAITCLSNCPCFDSNFGCLKENGTCNKYKEVLPQ